MSNQDSFINEVSEEVRKDKLYALMKRYGWIAVAVVVLVVGGASVVEWQRAKARAAAEATGDALMEAGVSMIYEERFKGTEGASGDWIEAQWGKIERAVGAVNDRWMSHMASHLNAGAIAVGCALGYLDFRMPDRDWRSKGASLADWYEGFSARPSMVDTAPS